MHNTISNSQRGRDKPVSVRGYRRILAQVQRQFGEHSALDFVKVVILCWLGSGTPREITATSMIRPRWPRVASELRLIHAVLPMQPSVLTRAETEFLVASKN
jgi:hypothetical protein